jgi:hypothetical protein
MEASTRFSFALLVAYAFVPGFCFLGCPSVPAQTDQYKIGERAVHIPTPQGFEMSLGLNSAYDEFLERAIGSNKLLTYFTDHQTHALLLQQRFPYAGCVTFSAQYPLNAENVEVSEQIFKDAIQPTKQHIGSSTFITSELLSKAQDSIDEAVKKIPGLNAKLEVGKVVSLGILEESANSLVLGHVENSTLTSQDSGHVQTSTKCVIGSINRIADRILFLYCSVPYRSAEDIKYAFSIFKPWRDETLSLNQNSN